MYSINNKANIKEGADGNLRRAKRIAIVVFENLLA